MKRSETDNIMKEVQLSFGSLWRHRSAINIIGKEIDRIKIGKKTYYLDNHIPGIILDTFDNLNYEQKDGTKPVIAAKRKTPHGWHLVINLPPGVSFKDIKNHKHYFQDSVNAWIDLEWKHGKCHMDIQTGELPEFIEYAFNPADYKMFLPIPIGYSRPNLTILNLPDSPHLLIAGATGWGKTSLINAIIHSVIHKAIVVMIDRKGVDFTYLEEHILVAITNEEAYAVLLALTAEYEKRKSILRKHKVKKWSQCPEEMPYIVLIVDEIAELNKECFALLDGLVRLARATGISVIAASQRTSVQVISGDTRSNFLARICFRVGSEADSRVVLGEDCGLAGQLPAIKGRAIYRYGLDTIEVQTMFLSDERAELMLQDIPVRKEVIPVVRESQVKRLRAR